MKGNRLAKRKQKPEVLETAKAEAKLRLNDLAHEMRMLLNLFPDLKDSFDPDELPVKFILKRGARKNKRKI